MSAITAKASRKMKKYAVLTREPRCFLGSFDFSWEQRKFEEIAVRSSVICSDDTLPRVEYEDIVSGTGRLNKDIYAKQSSKSGIVFHQGDVLYGKLRPYLQNWLLPTFDGLAVGDFWVLQPQNADSSFLYRLIQSRQFDEVANQSTGTKMPRADWKLVSKTVFSIPSNISEQAAIGTYFTALDSLITLHQRKCALLFSPFQAFISMMFTTSTFSWEQRKLASLCEKFTDGDWIESKDQSDFGVRLVQTGNVGVAEYLDKTNNKKWISEDTFDRLHCEEVLPGDILISRLPEPAGRACIVPLLGTKMITAVDCTIVRTAPDMSNKFLVQYLSSQAYFDDVNTCLAGGTRQRISRGNLANFNVPIPVKKSEQDAIGMFFGYLDNLITLHQRKCIFFTGRAGRLISTVNKKRITSSWEQRKLGDMMNVTSVKRIHQSDWTDSGVRFLRARDIVAAAKNEEPDDYLYISKEKYEEYSTLSGKVGVSDLLVTGVGTIGVPYLVRNLEPLYFKDGNIIWFQNLDKIDGKFLFYSFSAEQIQGFINESAGIGTVGTYTIESGKKTPISLPNQIEQAKVGEFFQQLDNLITLHQRKFEKLTNVKKSMLEKMFPQNGSSYPAVRFNGFTDPWEQRRFGDVFEEYSEKNRADLPPLTIVQGSGTIRRDESERALQYDKASLPSYKAVHEGDFIVHLRSFEGGLEKANSQGIVSPAYHTFRGEGIDSRFYYAYFRSKKFIDTDLKPHVYGIRDGRSIDIEGMKTIEIPFTSYPEQRLIGDAIGAINTLITLHQRELEKLQSIKKSLLDKMFA